ncbi:MAG: hypothetical protein ABIP54_02045 [Candidatus Andersenbacteria bacterium]
MANTITNNISSHDKFNENKAKLLGLISFSLLLIHCFTDGVNYQIHAVTTSWHFIKVLF